MKTRACSYWLLLVLVGITVGAGSPVLAEWSEAINLTELNDPAGAGMGSLTADQRIILFFRGDNLVEAWRQDPSGPFTEERLVSELAGGRASIADIWISADGLRLYFAEIILLDGKMQRVIKFATREAPEHLWTEVKTFLEIHVNGIIDTNPTLTADELTMMWYSQRYVADPEVRKYTATRSSVNAPFTNIRELPEFTAYTTATGLHLSGDGLRVYFTAIRNDVGFRNIYMGSRVSLETGFENINVLEGICGPDLQAGTPWLTPDEKTIYFSSNRTGQRGIWVSYWVEDPYDVAVGRIEAAIAAKREAIAFVNETLESDRLALEALNELRKAGTVDPVNILKAKIEIFRAIQRQLAARRELERSIADLEQSLAHLQAEPRQNLERKPAPARDKPVGPKDDKIVRGKN